MFYVSSIDLLKVDKFKNVHPLQLVEKRFDKDVLEDCYSIGLDKNEGYSWEYSMHRPLLSKEPVMGFRLVGEIRKDNAFRLSPAYTPEAQLLSSLRVDVSLTRELCSLSGTSFDYSKFLEDEVEKDREAVDSFEPNYAENSQYFEAMNNWLLDVRGNPFNEWGKWKNFEEWNK